MNAASHWSHLRCPHPHDDIDRSSGILLRDDAVARHDQAGR